MALVCAGALRAQTDSLTLRESVLTGRRNESALLISGQGIQLRTDSLRTMPMLLGSSDPVRLARYLPSLQASTEIDYGLHIQGNDHSHNLVSSGGVPIYGASHLLGIFSVFNPSHFESFHYSTGAPGYNRLGGMLDMKLPETMPDKAEGDFSLGLLAFQGTLRAPVGKSSLAVSLRRSYVNLLYSHFLRIGERPLTYGFTDANLTWQWQPSGRDRIWFDAYFGDDKTRMSTLTNAYGADFWWMNAMGAVHWQHDMLSAGTLRQTVFVTGYALDIGVDYSGMNISIPSDIKSAGYRANWTLGPWSAGAEVIAHSVSPQDISVNGTFSTAHTAQPVQYGQEMSLLGSYTRNFGPFGVQASMKGLLWHSPDGRWLPGASPELRLSWDFYRAGTLSAQAGVRHQYLMQAGITDLGLPCEFWFLAGDFNEPQKSLGGSVTYTLPFAGDMFSFQAEAYYRLLKNQVEYRTGFLDMIYAPYSLENAFLQGSGRAYGANFILQKKAGSLTGWISYAWGRSLRRFDGAGGEVPSAHERIHELDVVATYRTGRWTFAMTLLAASGTPYTPPVALYILSNHVIVQYGEHNSARLAPYRRLDLSASCRLGGTERFEHGINLSLYNALGARNELFRTLSLDDEGFWYDASAINIRFMPSVCYYIKF